MIQLTRLNNTHLAVNCDLIKYVEQAPDTVITLLNGEKLVVRETTEEVIDRVCRFRRAILTPIAPADPEATTNDRRNNDTPVDTTSSAERPNRG
jgi:flagellar protein FlbD